MSNFYGYQPFASGIDSTKCDPDISPSGLSLLRCPVLDGCDNTCDIEDNKFLNCYIVSFNGKLGFGANESSVTIELVEAYQIDPCVNTNCTPNPSDSPDSGVCINTTTGEITSYSSIEDCLQQGSTQWICGITPEEFNNGNGRYNGQLGHIYTFIAGNFSFRGVLTNHNYKESESGYRYSVTLTDSRQILDSVKVIVGGYYSEVPTELKFNLINALYENEPSVTDISSICGLKCKDFTSSGANHRGMLLKKALMAVNNKYCQVPISEGCLIIDVQEVINICSDYFRVTSNELSVLELITLACNESGYEFYSKIEGNTIKIYVISQKEPVDNTNLFNFIESIDKNILIDRDYGQELTFEKSKKFIIGDNYRYLLMLDEAQCAQTEPTGIMPSCSVGFIPPGSYQYRSAAMDFIDKITDLSQESAILASPSPSGICNENL